MKKIVELLINFEDLEFDDLGVEVMSIVDKPAIGVDFHGILRTTICRA